MVCEFRSFHFCFRYDIIYVIYIMSIECAIITSMYAPNTVTCIMVLANMIYLCYVFLNSDRSNEVMGV